MLRFLLYLLLTIQFISIVRSSEMSSDVSRRDPKLLFPFVYLQVPNYLCESKNEAGPIKSGCTTRVECKKKGTVVGSCSGGYGACCLINARCKNGEREVKVGGDSSNFTHLIPPIAGDKRNRRDCEFILIKRTGTVQVKLDFLKFKTADANETGNCMDDQRMTITGATIALREPFVVCGDLAGQHMYLEYGESNEIRLNIRLSNKESNNYKIVITQMFINNPNIAPSGCLQYFQDQIGKAWSFGYPNRQTNNQKYSICVESKGRSKIKWMGCTDQKQNFLISGNLNTDIESPFPASLIPRQCNKDYIQILGIEKKCGTQFTEVISEANPHVLWVNFDDSEEDGILRLGTLNAEMCAQLMMPDFDCSWQHMTCVCISVGPNGNSSGNGPWDQELNNTGFCLEYAIN